MWTRCGAAYAVCVCVCEGGLCVFVCVCSGCACAHFAWKYFVWARYITWFINQFAWKHATCYMPQSANLAPSRPRSGGTSPFLPPASCSLCVVKKRVEGVREREGKREKVSSSCFVAFPQLRQVLWQLPPLISSYGSNSISLLHAIRTCRSIAFVCY